MKLASLRLPISFALIVLLFIEVFRIVAFASGPSCVDVNIIFARGSSDNPSALYVDLPFSNDYRNLEKVPGSFFQNFKSNLTRDYPSVTYDAVSVHNFPNLYSDLGYRAVGIFGPKTVNNIFEAELSWWPMGEYRQSVKGGTDEVAGYIKSQISDCPDQILVVGGYSQGAHVMGDALFKLSDSELDHIHAIALFGDPKYIASDAGNNTPIDYLGSPSAKPKAELWKRGTASLIDRGILDARVPYVPDKIKNRTLSWCFNDDFICTGGSGLLQSARPLLMQEQNTLNKDTLGAGHTRYPSRGVPEAVTEIIQRLSPKLNYIEAVRGGKDASKSFNLNTPISASDKPIDVMFVVNISYNVDDVLGQLRFNTLDVLNPFKFFYNNVEYGVTEYTENGTTTSRVPRSVLLQNLNSDTTTLKSSFSRKLAYGGLSGGGLDLADPHQLGIEKAIRATSWRKESVKHVIVITERPLLGSVTYNICNSAVRIGFGIDTENKCTTNPALEAGSSIYHSEKCAIIYEMLISDTCYLKMDPGGTYNVTRDENSLIELLNSTDIAVSFVVPHGFKSGTDIASARSKLKDLAGLGGGLFIEYPTFTKANYTDMIWQILNHEPKKIKLKSIQDFDSINSIYSESDNNKPLQLFTGSSQLLTINSSKIYDSYYWDVNGDDIYDEITYAPQLETKFTNEVDNKYLKVKAQSSSEVTNIIVPIKVVPGEAGSINFPATPSVTAKMDSLGNLIINWSCELGAVIFIDLDGDGAPDASAPCSLGTLTFGSFEYISSIKAWTESYAGKSQVSSVPISQYIPPDPEDNETDGGQGQGEGGSDTGNKNNDNQGSDNTGQSNNENDQSNNDKENLDEQANNNDSDINKDEPFNYKEITGIIIIGTMNSLQQSTSNRESIGSRETYNPQKTQDANLGAEPIQKAKSVSDSFINENVDTSTKVINMTSESMFIHVTILVVLPVIILIYRLYIRPKR